MDSLEELEQRAEAGDAESKFRLGVELLGRPDSSEHMDRGISLVEAASAEGHSPATELCSVFEAMGIARPVDWDRALDRLQLAAEQGAAGARRQLLLFADNEAPADVPQSADQGYWAQVRSRISFERLIGSPERRSLCDAPRIRAIEGFATAPECDWLMERARDRLVRATIIDVTGDHRIDPGRSNTGKEFLVHDMDLVLEMMRCRISAATRIPVPVFEPTQILHYEVGEEFQPHHDFLDPANPNHREQLRAGQRIATFLLYLNDAFEGGETDFPAARVRYRGRTGDAVFFANVGLDGKPDPRTLHAGRPPTSGEKWILSQWIRDRAGPAA